MLNLEKTNKDFVLLVVFYIRKKRRGEGYLIKWNTEQAIWKVCTSTSAREERKRVMRLGNED